MPSSPPTPSPPSSPPPSSALSSNSPTVDRWEFARRIRVRRERLGLRIDTVAQHLGFTRNFYSAVENERSMLAADKLEPLFDLLEVTGHDRVELAALNKSARRRPEVGALAGDEAGERYIGLEMGASRIRTFESFSWPGLFQTPDYASAVFSADPRRPRAAIEDYVAFRTRRQQRILETGTPIEAVVSEAVVKQNWGHDELRRRQVEYVLTLIEHDNVVMRVLPFSTLPGMIVSCSTLVLLSFESSHLPDLSYDESLGGVHVLEADDPAYEPIRLAWQDAEGRALDPDESAEFLASHLPD